MYSEDKRKEKQREATRRYRERHPEHKEKAAARYLEKKAADSEFLVKQREKTKQWRARNPEATKEIQRRSDSKRYYDTKAATYALLGNKCCRCGFSDSGALQVDHIVAIGDAERRRLGHYGRKLYREILKDPSNFQLLCANCNWVKRKENGEAKGKPPRNDPASSGKF